MNYKELLKEARDLLLMCTLTDKSNQCEEMVEKIDNAFKEEDEENE